ncbi:MAG: sulfite exporter TauE/SafE family protein [Defluviitaleaceae bacterium]|nr:sulfite exporter TauE/SafE family protein [Defluviitaleaceae bacterium]
MFIGILYFFIILVVISISAIAGISGGVVLRPIFDAIGYHNATSIAFYNGIAVITMAVASTVKQVLMGTRINFIKVLFLAVGSFIGGIIGQFLMDTILYHIGENELQIIQSVLSIASLIFVLAFTRENIKKYDYKGSLWYVLTGLGLGAFSTLLAIGGGPINVIVFVILFGITLKEATVYSITTIFFAQIARVGTMFMEYGWVTFDLRLLFFIVPAAVIAGIVGGRLNILLAEVTVMKVFKFVVIATILLNIYNVLQMALF